MFGFLGATNSAMDSNAEGAKEKTDAIDQVLGRDCWEFLLEAFLVM